MLLNLYNDTDKALLIIYENERFDLLSNSSVRLEINEAAHIEIFGKKSSKKGFLQRFKEELSLNEIDLLHFRFGIKYSSYLKTGIDIKPNCKKMSVRIKEALYKATPIIELRCFEIKDFASQSSYACLNKAHKSSFLLCSHLALLVKYGIIAFVGLLFILSFLLNPDLIGNESADVITFSILAALIFAVFIVLYVIRLIQIIKLSNRI